MDESSTGPCVIASFRDDRAAQAALGVLHTAGYETIVITLRFSHAASALSVMRDGGNAALMLELTGLGLASDAASGFLADVADGSVLVAISSSGSPDRAREILHSHGADFQPRMSLPEASVQMNQIDRTNPGGPGPTAAPESTHRRILRLHKQRVNVRTTPVDLTAVRIFQRIVTRVEFVPIAASSEDIVIEQLELDDRKVAEPSSRARIRSIPIAHERYVVEKKRITTNDVSFERRRSVETERHQTTLLHEELVVSQYADDQTP